MFCIAVSMADLQNRRMLSRAAAIMLAIGNLTGSFLLSLVKWAEGTGDYTLVCRKSKQRNFLLGNITVRSFFPRLDEPFL